MVQVIFPTELESAKGARYLEHRETVAAIVGQLARRYRLQEEDCQELEAETHLKMVARADQVFGQFEGRSSLKTYLYTVVTSIFWEWRNKRMGRWRPSVAAVKMGKAAQKLEELTQRDGFLFSEAVAILKTNFGFSESEETFEQMQAAFPRRKRLQEIPGSDYSEMPAGEDSPEEMLLAKEAQALGKHTVQAIRRCVRTLPKQDQLILKLQFYEDVKLVDVARSLAIRPKDLYRRVEKILKQMRKHLKNLGLAKESPEALGQAIRGAMLHELAPEAMAGNQTETKRSDHVTVG